MSAFASNAADFLVKPFDAKRLTSALDAATAAIGQARSAATPADPLLKAERCGKQRRFMKRLAVEAGEKIALLRTEYIEWLQASGNYVRIHLREKVYLLPQSLEALAGLLDPSRFLRFHRDVIVNLDHVEGFHLPDQGDMFVRLKSGFCLPLPKVTRAGLRRVLKRPFMA